MTSLKLSGSAIVLVFLVLAGNVHCSNQHHLPGGDLLGGLLGDKGLVGGLIHKVTGLLHEILNTLLGLVPVNRKVTPEMKHQMTSMAKTIHSGACLNYDQIKQLHTLLGVSSILDLDPKHLAKLAKVANITDILIKEKQIEQWRTPTKPDSENEDQACEDPDSTDEGSEPDQTTRSSGNHPKPSSTTTESCVTTTTAAPTTVDDTVPGCENATDTKISSVPNSTPIESIKKSIIPTV